MQLQPTFSIITITYNAVRLVEQTLLNVLSQSYPNIEYIVIDGGSTDGTVDIIRRYESGLAYWVSEPDKGIYDAMNKGLQKATGDYVWFINAGDTLCSSDTVQSVVSKLQKRKALPDIIYGETNIVDEERRSLGLRRLRAPRKLSWKSFRMGMLVCRISSMGRRISWTRKGGHWDYAASGRRGSSRGRVSGWGCWFATSRSYQNVRLPRHMICNIAIRPISTGVSVA